MPPAAPPPPLHDMVRRFGWNSTSYQVLDPGLRTFWVDDDACVAYADTGTAWVAAGAPLCADERLAPVAAAFAAAAAEAGRRTCFFAVEQRFVERVPTQQLGVGAMPVWHPARWPERRHANRDLREQLRRARTKGVRIEAVAPAEVARGELGPQLTRLTARWLGTRPMAPLGFLARVAPLAAAEGRVLLAARREGRLVGFLSAAPIYARNGWLVDDLLRDPDAPNGSSEALIDAAFARFGALGAERVTLGLTPLYGEVGAPLLAVRQRAGALYNFAGLARFRTKLDPDRWEPVYLAYTAQGTATRALADALVAFAEGEPWRFAWQSLGRHITASTDGPGGEYPDVL